MFDDAAYGVQPEDRGRKQSGWIELVLSRGRRWNEHGLSKTTFSLQDALALIDVVRQNGLRSVQVFVFQNTQYIKAGDMQVISREVDEAILIGDDVFVQVLEISDSYVRLGISSPDRSPSYWEQTLFTADCDHETEELHAIH